MPVLLGRRTLKGLSQYLLRRAEASWRRRSGPPPAHLWMLAGMKGGPPPEMLARLPQRSRYWLEQVRNAVSCATGVSEEERERLLAAIMFVQLVAQQRLARQQGISFAPKEPPKPIEFASDYESDRQIVNKLFTRVQDGDDAAYVEFVELYQKRLYELAYYYLVTHYSLRSEQDAEDAVQQGLMKIYLQLKTKSFDPSKSGWAWVKRIVINEAITMWRKRRVRDRGKQDLDLTDDDCQSRELVDHTAKDPSDAAELNDDFQSLVKVLDQLPEHHRSVFILRHVEGHSRAEVAEILDIPVGTVDSRLNAACKKLQELLGDLTEDREESEGELGTNRVIGWLDTSSGNHCVRLEHLQDPAGVLYCLELLDGTGQEQNIVVWRRYMVLREGYPNAETVISVESELPQNGDARALQTYPIRSLVQIPPNTAETLWDSFEQQQVDDPACIRWWKVLAEREVANLRVSAEIRHVLGRILSALADNNAGAESVAEMV